MKAESEFMRQLKDFLTILQHFFQRQFLAVEAQLGRVDSDGI